MQTNFSSAQLADPDFKESEKILRACVHCGFCTATCPTYTLLGDELDSPRGRIYLMKEMLEKNRPADAETVKHIDRCLGCLSCMTTCPSGVHYAHLLDHARHHIEATYKRPWQERTIRALLAFLMPYPDRFRAAMAAGRLARPFARFMPKTLQTMLRLVPARLEQRSRTEGETLFPAEGKRVARVALLTGCVQPVLAPRINEATIALLTRHGCEVVVPAASGCCGALTHHLGRDARDSARANIDAWANANIDYVVINASGCGTTVKDYGHALRDDPKYAARATAISARTRDITELMTEIGLRPPIRPTGQRVAYHSACSLQHGQQLRDPPKTLLRQAGFQVVDIPESHLCCGSAGTYNLLQPDIAGQLRDRKLKNIATTKPDLIAAGNIGCLTQISGGTKIPVLHTVELLDWATGGARPTAISS